jgi:precorrin-6B C5,15-methyltransferase / cobalt-precorrin-6B C5,C15-methyltransferase
MNKRLTIVGIGQRPLDDRAREAMASAELVLGSRRLVEVFASYPEYPESKGRMRRIDSVDETMRVIREAFAKDTKEIVLLGSGDPLFFGIGRRAVEELGSEVVEIIPDLSSLQVAFSRIKEPWDNALFVSLHAGPDPRKRRRLKYSLEDLPALVETHGTLGILTDKENNPGAIAARFVRSGLPPGSLVMYVGERIGYPDERITKGTPEEVGALSFGDPNVVIVKKAENGQSPVAPTAGPRFGLREAEIAHSRGLITKSEVRAVVIHALRLPEDGVLWDVGAGSGALSIETARLCPGMRIFSIERDPEQLAHIEHNRSTFGVSNVTVVRGEAPPALSSLVAPDRVFIGGSGGNLEGIIEVVRDRMERGIVIVNAATLETLNDAISGLENAGLAVDVTEISVARSRRLTGKRLMTALNPVFMVKGEKE